GTQGQRHGEWAVGDLARRSVVAVRAGSGLRRQARHREAADPSLTHPHAGTRAPFHGARVRESEVIACGGDLFVGDLLTAAHHGLVPHPVFPPSRHRMCVVHGAGEGSVECSGCGIAASCCAELGSGSAGDPALGHGASRARDARDLPGEEQAGDRGFLGAVDYAHEGAVTVQPCLSAGLHQQLRLWDEPHPSPTTSMSSRTRAEPATTAPAASTRETSTARTRSSPRISVTAWRRRKGTRWRASRLVYWAPS